VIRINAGRRLNQCVIRIAISAEAFEAIAATLPLGTVGYESELTPNGERLVWLEEAWVNKLDTIRMPGESYSDIILWLVALEAGATRQ
jgi:hypothetical protein